jgi:hypothetical protein
MLTTKRTYLGTPGLTDGYDPELTRQIGKSLPGMAHFAATGPFGTSCALCAHLGYHKKVMNKSGDTVRTTFRRDCCGKFHELTGRHGPPIEAGTESCRYFKRR